MTISSEINATYYAIRLISHRIDVSQVKADAEGESSPEEFTVEERARAFNIIEEIQEREQLLIHNFTDLIAEAYLNSLADRVEELAHRELTEADYDTERADLILETLRDNTQGPGVPSPAGPVQGKEHQGIGGVRRWLQDLSFPSPLRDFLFVDGGKGKVEHYSPSPNIDHEHALPNQPFFSWLRTQTTLFISQLLALLSFTYLLASSIYYVEDLGHSKFLATINPRIQLFVDFAHIVFLIVFIVVLIKVLDDNDRGSHRAGVVYTRVFNESLSATQLKSLLRRSKIQLRRFKLYFLLFWFGMLVLYISFAFKHSFEQPAAQTSRPQPTQSQPVQQTDAQPAASEAVHPQQPASQPAPPERTLKEFGEVFKHLLFPFLTFALNNLSMLFAFWCFIVLYLPSHGSQSKNKKWHKLLVNFSSLTVGVLTVSFPLLLFTIHHDGFLERNLTAYVTVFNGSSGVLNAVVLALLIARLDSKLIGLPSWLICVLYFYSAVQPLFVVFEQPGAVFKIIQTFVLIAVFIFKIYFFLIIIYTLQTGRMLNYLLCFPFLSKRVNSVFNNQFEIKTHKVKEHSFSFSIMKKGVKIYSTDATSRSMENLDKRINELREIMKRGSAYRTRDSGGTYWVEVMHHDGDVICRSISLKSEGEARDLIEESIEKIPYCKYDRY